MKYSGAGNGAMVKGEKCKGVKQYAPAKHSSIRDYNGNFGMPKKVKGHHRKS